MPVLAAFERQWEVTGSILRIFEFRWRNNPTPLSALSAKLLPHPSNTVLETAIARIAHEWDLTVAWLRRFSADDDARCWSGTGLAVLEHLRDDFGNVAGLEIYRDYLVAQIHSGQCETDRWAGRARGRRLGAALDRLSPGFSS